MHWKLKARIQNTVSLLPSSASYAAYYWIQRHFGGLRRMNPTSRLTAGIETWKRIQEQGNDPSGKVFFEVGTGRSPLVPLAYWLMGAEKTITIDLNPYLKSELVQESIQYLAENREMITGLFESRLDTHRFNELMSLSEGADFATTTFLDLCSIDYIAPGDAAKSGLAPGSIDFHTSYTVFEHIPPEVLRQILQEGNRIIKNDGLFVHRIDYSDHFSHADKSISAVNFLQFSDEEWERLAGNRYMYMNRLRHDDYLDLFQSVGQQILDTHPVIDRRSQQLVRSGQLQMVERFSAKSEEILSITGAWIVSKLP